MWITVSLVWWIFGYVPEINSSYCVGQEFVLPHPLAIKVWREASNRMSCKFILAGQISSQNNNYTNLFILIYISILTRTTSCLTKYKTLHHYLNKAPGVCILHHSMFISSILQMSNNQCLVSCWKYEVLLPAEPCVCLDSNLPNSSISCPAKWTNLTVITQRGLDDNHKTHSFGRNKNTRLPCQRALFRKFLCVSRCCSLLRCQAASGGGLLELGSIFGALTPWERSGTFCSL